MSLWQLLLWRQRLSGCVSSTTGSSISCSSLYGHCDSARRAQCMDNEARRLFFASFRLFSIHFVKEVRRVITRYRESSNPLSQASAYIISRLLACTHNMTVDRTTCNCRLNSRRETFDKRFAYCGSNTSEKFNWAVDCIFEVICLRVCNDCHRRGSDHCTGSATKTFETGFRFALNSKQWIYRTAAEVKDSKQCSTVIN